MQTLLFNKKDLSDVTIANVDEAPLADGAVRVKIGPFALTSNNVTYLVTAEQIGYWKYFDPAAYGLDAPDTGRMPVWGYGEVTQSKSDEIAVGELIYGYFPAANEIDIVPSKVTKTTFFDGAAHRVPLHPIYNSYTRVEHDPGFASHRELQPIFRPLFTTSFLIDDFLDDEDFFGAEQVVILSASSKTAMGTAFCLKKRGGVKVVGLTSPGNVEFVKATGYYDQVLAYDAVDQIADKPSVLVDMAGNGGVMAALYEHLGANVKFNSMIGKTHISGARPPKPEAGAPPVLFFAPDRGKKRFADWGADGFMQKLAARWLPFLDSAGDWISVEHHDDVTGFLRVYKDMLNGKTDPKEGHLVTF